MADLEKEHRYRDWDDDAVSPPGHPGAATSPRIRVFQRNPAALTSAHNVTNPVVRPAVTTTPPATFRFSEHALSAEIHEFLFEVRKAGSIFWVGAAVPKGTTDFTRAQVFFHPTVIQNGTVVADDKDYHDFKGGWSASIQRYVAMQGGQLAKADRLMPLLVPFTTMAALKLTKKGGLPAENMFSDRPVDTLNSVMAAIESQITGKAGGKPILAKVGVSSFSSGITALRLFLAAMRSSGLVKEIIDFDSPHIRVEPKSLTRSPGAVSKCFTQTFAPHPTVGWVTVTSKHFADVSAFGHYSERFGQRLHARIGWMMFFQAMTNSVIS